MGKLLTLPATAGNLIKPPQIPKFVEHKIAASSDEPLTAKLYEYLMAGNGLFVRARRQEFTATIPICRVSIKGLPEIEAGIVWHKPKLPRCLFQEILDNARANSDARNFKEDFYAVFWSERLNNWDWAAISRERSLASTIADDERAEYAAACLELHTHPPGAIHFSRADDRDESGKFRLFGILIDVHASAKIRLRYGVYDYFEQLMADEVGELPDGILDLNRVDRAIKKAFL